MIKKLFLLGMLGSIALINANGAGGAGAPRAGSPELPDIVGAIAHARKTDPEIASLPFSTLPALKHMLEAAFPALARSYFFETTPIWLAEFTDANTNATIIDSIHTACSEYTNNHFQFNQEIDAVIANHRSCLSPKPDEFLAIKLDATNAPRLVAWLAAEFPWLTALHYFDAMLFVAPGEKEFTVDDPDLLALGGDFMMRHDDASIQQHFRDFLGGLEAVVQAQGEAEGKFLPVAS